MLTTRREILARVSEMANRLSIILELVDGSALDQKEKLSSLHICLPHLGYVENDTEKNMCAPRESVLLTWLRKSFLVRASGKAYFYMA